MNALFTVCESKNKTKSNRSTNCCCIEKEKQVRLAFAEYERLTAEVIALRRRIEIDGVQLPTNGAVQLQNQLQYATNENALLKQSIERYKVLEQTYNDQHGRLTAAYDLIAKLQQDLSIAKLQQDLANNNNNNQTSAEQQQQIILLQQTLANQTNEYNNKLKEHARKDQETDRKLQETNDALNHARQAIQDLNTDFQTQDRQKQKTEQMLIQLTKEKQAQTDFFSQLEQDFNAVQTQHDVNIDKLKKELMSMETDNNHLKELLSDQQHDNSNLNQDLTHARSENDRLHRALKSCQEELVDATTDLAEKAELLQNCLDDNNNSALQISKKPLTPRNTVLITNGFTKIPDGFLVDFGTEFMNHLITQFDNLKTFFFDDYKKGQRLYDLVHSSEFWKNRLGTDGDRLQSVLMFRGINPLNELLKSGAPLDDELAKNYLTCIFSFFFYFTCIFMRANKYDNHLTDIERRTLDMIKKKMEQTGRQVLRTAQKKNLAPYHSDVVLLWAELKQVFFSTINVEMWLLLFCTVTKASQEVVQKLYNFKVNNTQPHIMTTEAAEAATAAATAINNENKNKTVPKRLENTNKKKKRNNR